jgi:hypothetical protein
MALHRDIFWIGRQWAVTGSGIQAVDQRLKGAFDIDRSKVWEDGLLASLGQLAWFNATDFEKALSAARARFPVAPQPAPTATSAQLEVAVAAGPLVKPLRLCTKGRLARFLPAWRIRA